MIMADVLTWFLIIAGTYLVLVCYWLASAALFPHVVEGCRQQYGRHPFAATLVGLAIVAPVLFVGIAAVRVIPNPLPGNAIKILLMSPLLLAFLGSAGLALRIGEGLTDLDDVGGGSMPRPWRPVLRGGLVLAPTFLVPFFGWFVLLPWVLVSGVGTAALTLLARRSS
jgi:hypothetical protein